MMRHLANAHSVTGPASSIYRTSFSGVWRARSRRPVKQLFNLLIKFAVYLLLLELYHIKIAAL